MQRKADFGSSHWLDVEHPSDEELRAIAERYGLPEPLAQDCLDPDHLPKFNRMHKGGFVVVRAYDEESLDGAIDILSATRKVSIFWGENFLITVHRAHLPWLQNLWNEWQLKSGVQTPPDLSTALYEIIAEALFTFEAPIDRATVAIDGLEESIFQDVSPTAPPVVLETAYIAKRRATLFKRILRLTRDILPAASKIGDPNSPAIQSLKEELERLFAYSDDLVETANDLVQMSISLSSNRTNDLVRLLTLVSLFLLPLNLVTGIYGMNFTEMPELKMAWGYPATLIVMILIEVAIYLWLRGKKWLV